ncbi:MAG: histidine kinase dimerization/phosphoacceptor domain -containing protein [Candidatus Sphingomonas phytovorans]|nr:histidine kinase dimerization/phosphoacceptor domain -containing protein [Sphingomonas sp.]WEJ97874.1 MAG: histidine kinase dimerization/phosphoacceptor domain -containing protein [Sphingomonas sp.]
MSPAVPVWVTQVGVALLTVLGAKIVRLVFDIVAGGAAPFALIYPAIMLATLFARAFAGTLTATIMIVYIWYFIYPVERSFRFATSANAFAVAIVIVTAIMTIAIAELFRRTARRATQARDREIADRDLFLAEFDHRMKNNFAIVAGLLDLQKRRASDPATVQALETAQMRVDSIARAHRHLYRGTGQPGTVEIRDYLTDLCAALAESLFLQGGITLSCDSDQAAVPRDRAVSIGLVVNELVTNAAKHAFPGRDLGTITVTLRNRSKGGWRITVADDGVGMPKGAALPGKTSGLGSRLVEAFARQAGGTLSTESDESGTRVVMKLES